MGIWGPLESGVVPGRVAALTNIASKELVPISVVATLGHAGARALATSGRAPPVQRCLLSTNPVLNGLEIKRRSIAMYNTEFRVSPNFESHQLMSLIRSSYVRLP